MERLKAGKYMYIISTTKHVRCERLCHVVIIF